LFTNYVLRNTSLELSAYVRKDILIVISKAGIIFSKIKGPGSVSAPVLYSNIKNIQYGNVYDAQVSERDILLNTDKGFYMVNFPTDSELNNVHNDPAGKYKFILNYNKNSYSIKTGDTIIIDQHDWKFQFDIINPTGYGDVKYAYSIPGYDAEMHELDGHELILPHFDADKYFTVLVTAQDDEWRSENTIIHLYVRPYWWQTSAGLRIVWISAILFIILLFSTVVLITKRVVTKKTIKRNLQLETELKSIYAQINPHFIFNSLSTALYFIKMKRMEDAYAHVSKFSRLLRAYIKSSRNKFIALTDEVTNLRNYIELQQTRFKDKFDYEILIDEAISGHTKIPSLLLQPIVENAINHGLVHRETKGHLKIEFKAGSAANEIICIIDDNGIGRKQSKFIREDSTLKDESYGDKLIKDLVRIFNKYEQMNINIDYIDKEEPLSGTTVQIHIKNNMS
jgi:two-component sensor histidine kinase